jgi:ribosomal protein S18 acetylase RimI-like enzyme
MSGRNKLEMFDFKRRDFGELAELTRAYFTELQQYDGFIGFAENWEAHYRQLMERAMGSPQFYVRGLRVDGATAGFIMFGCREDLMWEASRRGYLSNIYVAPALRRRGLGRFMVDGALQTLRQAEVDVVELDVYDTNEVGRLFWKSFGFERFKERLRISLK